jgi:cell volume regulation protein A
MVADGQLILLAGALLLAGVVVSLLAERVRLPALVLFLGLGMVLGSDGTGWIDFGRDAADYELTLLIGTVALAAILFHAGLEAGFPEIRPVLRPAIGLAVVGTAGTAAITGVAAILLFDLSALEGLLLGSILAASDGAAVFALLRGLGLRRKLARTLEGEAGLNDPVAVLLVLGLIELLLHPQFGALDLALLFGQELAIGAAVGLVLPWLLLRLAWRARAAPRGVHLVASLGSLALAYGGAAAIGGSGFLAAYLAGRVHGSVEGPAEEPVAPSTTGCPRSPRSCSSSCSGCSCSRASSVRSSWAGWRWRSWSPSSPGRSPRRSPSRSTATPRASGCCSDGPACAARSRWCSPCCP